MNNLMMRSNFSSFKFNRCDANQFTAAVVASLRGIWYTVVPFFVMNEPNEPTHSSWLVDWADVPLVEYILFHAVYPEEHIPCNICTTASMKNVHATSHCAPHDILKWERLCKPYFFPWNLINANRGQPESESYVVDEWGGGRTCQTRNFKRCCLFILWTPAEAWSLTHERSFYIPVQHVGTFDAA